MLRNHIIPAVIELKNKAQKQILSFSLNKNSEEYVSNK
jgi:hypothetical protein